MKVFLRNILVFAIWLLPFTIAQLDPHYQPNRTGIVHLFEWKWNDIAVECEQFLGPSGYAGVQVSPVNENAIVAGRPWFERYQPMSYNLTTRSGNEAELAAMIERCNRAGVRIYVDVVFNHMAPPSGNGDNVIGTAGSIASPNQRRYPIFGPEDFHQSCQIGNYNDPNEVRACELSGLPDLNQSRRNVQDTIVDFLNRLVELGVAGFRVDACKHMEVEDLAAIYGNVKNLRTDFGFAEGARPFIFQEVIDVGGEGVKKTEYTGLGAVTEFSFSSEVGMVFQGRHGTDQLTGLGPSRTFLPSKASLVFVDNHDNQRGHGGGGIVLTYQKPKAYVSAVAFMLANNYGIPRVMSSFEFNDPSQGPPADEHGNIRKAECGNGWVCEHRWVPIKNMIKFRIEAGDSPIENWTIHNGSGLSFCRGNVGCAIFTTGKGDFKAQVQTSLAAGRYCDIISGGADGPRCVGKEINVDEHGRANIVIKQDEPYAVVALLKGIQN